MVKKVGWYWIAFAALAGWTLGSGDEPTTTQSTYVAPKVQQTKPVSLTAQKPIKQNTTKPITRKVERVASLPRKENVIRQQPQKRQESVKPKTVTAQRKMYVDASRLNVRQSPTLSGKQVWTLKRDEEVIVTSKKGEWLYVQGARYQGWVFGSYLTPNKAPATQQTSVRPRKQTKPKLSTKEVKALLIRRSIGLYSGSCPCPYNRDRAGRKCGRRSAYSRPGGAEPLCYPNDVTDGMVSDYLARL